jgi:dihydrofolate synthase/folylpolyglutamate synthase
MNRSEFTLAQWLSWMEASHPVAIDMGLDRCRQVYDSLNLSFEGVTVITVAGTNGKGSSVAMLDAILQAAGYATACYTSPHLSRYNERIRFNSLLSTDDQLVSAFNAVDQARGNISLTYFEMGTLAALWLIAQRKPDVALLEVGLGGRLDVVNLVDADVAVITTIDIDHVDWLGDNRESIGREKAGIFRESTPAVCGDPAPPNSISDYAQLISAPLFQVGQDFNFTHETNSWDWNGADSKKQPLTYTNLPIPSLPLQNAATVLQAIALSGLDVTESDISRGLTVAKVAGRMDCFAHNGQQYLLDVAHNPQSAQYLGEQLAKLKKPITLVLGMLSDKDCIAVIEALAPIVNEWHFVGLSVNRGQTADQLKACWEKANKPQASDAPVCHHDVSTALAYLEQRAETKLIVVAGSFYTVGEAYAALGRDVI